MRSKTTKAFTEVKNADLRTWKIFFWLVKRKTNGQYTVLQVDMDNALKKRFKGYVKTQLQDRAARLEEYDFVHADDPEVLLTVDAESTLFSDIEQAIDKSFDNPHAQSRADLLKSWAYVIHLEKGADRLYALRKINALTQPRKVKSINALFFRDHRLTDVDEDEVFMIDPVFDFFVYQGITFISNKRAFESALNFREGMEKNRDTFLSQLSDLGFLSDVEPIRAAIGSNLRMLQRVSSIQKQAHYQKPDFFKKLMAAHAANKFQLTIGDDGRIVVTPENVDLILTLLRNYRVESQIDGTIYHAVVATQIN